MNAASEDSKITKALGDKHSIRDNILYRNYHLRDGGINFGDVPTTCPRCLCEFVMKIKEVYCKNNARFRQVCSCQGCGLEFIEGVADAEKVAA